MSAVHPPRTPETVVSSAFEPGPNLGGPLGAVFTEVGAGGFPSIDSGVEFWGRVNALLPADGHGVVVDLGAGRGQFLEDAVPFRRWLHDLRPRAGRVIGLDVDPVVRENPALHEAHVVGVGEAFPLPAASADLVVSDWTFEHIADPERVAAEIDRVLRPGGWLAARTPRKWGSIGMGARAVPNALHDRALRRLQPTKAARDTFPVQYRLNSQAALHRCFPDDRFEHWSYAFEPAPAYVGRSVVGMRAGTVLSRFLPARAGALLMVFLRKKPAQR